MSFDLLSEKVDDHVRDQVLAQPERDRADPRPSFHPTVPGLQIAWDSTSLGELKTCPRRYFYTIVEGWRPRAESAHLTFGLLYHKALEIYDHNRAAGRTFEEARREAVRYALEATMVRLPSGGVRPWQSDIPAKNRESLIRSIVWYLHTFREDPATTVQLANGKPAVELSFRFHLDMDIGGEQALLSGHLDRLVEFQDDLLVLDRKTTQSPLDARYFASFSPDNQMTLYTLASQVVFGIPAKGVMIDAVQVGVTFSRFARFPVLRHASELKEWSSELRYYLHQAEAFATAQFWPKNDKACGMYGGCPFRVICSEPPEMRKKWLQGLFFKKPWDPLEVRGDI